MGTFLYLIALPSIDRRQRRDLGRIVAPPCEFRFTLYSLTSVDFRINTSQGTHLTKYFGVTSRI